VSPEPSPGVIQVRHPSEETGELRFLGGSASDDFNTVLAHQVTTILWLAHADEDERAKFRTAAAGLAGIGPRDELEGMLRAQLIAAHNRLGPFGLGLGRVWRVFCNDQFWIGLGGGHWRWWNRVRLWQSWIAQAVFWIDADHTCVGHRGPPELSPLPGPVACDEADHHTADHQGGDAEAQDPTEDSGLGEGLHHCLLC